MNTAATLGEASWYAVSTRSRQEKVAASMLESFGIENFLPLSMERRQWSDRKQVVNVPLFPGYLFVRVPMLHEVQLRVLKVPESSGSSETRAALKQFPMRKSRASRPSCRTGFLAVLVRSPRLGIASESSEECSRESKVLLFAPVRIPAW